MYLSRAYRNIPRPKGRDINVIREKSQYTILPLESRNQESAQIPGFWIPMVKWCTGIFL
jgi:hypothetical protein